MLPGRAVELPLFLRLLPERAVVRLAQVGATARVPELEVREDRLHLRGGERARCGLAAAHDRTDLGLLLLGHRGGEFGGDTKAFAWGGGGRKFTILRISRRIGSSGDRSLSKRFDNEGGKSA